MSSLSLIYRIIHHAMLAIQPMDISTN